MCVAPDDQLLATGSQDKTAKLWDRRDLSLVATLRGHKRGIWCAQFSPADRLLATGSADAVIKLWSLAEFTCIKQLEGHDCSVLGLDWMTDNQIVSSATDGLIKAGILILNRLTGVCKFISTFTPLYSLIFFLHALSFFPQHPIFPQDHSSIIYTPEFGLG